MCSAVLVGGRSAYIHEFCSQAAKRSDVDCAELHVCLFADCQEWHFQAAKGSDKSSTILQEGRFADVQEILFKTVKLSDMGCADLQGVSFLILKNSRFRLRNI